MIEPSSDASPELCALLLMLADHAKTIESSGSMIRMRLDPNYRQYISKPVMNELYAALDDRYGTEFQFILEIETQLH